MVIFQLPGVTICPGIGDFKKSTYSGDKFVIENIATNVGKSVEEVQNSTHYYPGKGINKSLAFRLFANATILLGVCHSATLRAWALSSPSTSTA